MKTKIVPLLALLTGALAAAAVAPEPKPTGKLVDLGGFRLHVNCAGKGSPTVVVENGLGDFSADWILVQERVAHFARVCTYDRAGYAWSDPGPKPRTFSQINFELHNALGKLGERGPFVLVGHSYGGGVVRNFAATYPQEVSGMVLVDAAHEGLRVGTGGGKTVRLGADARGIAIPPPRKEVAVADQPSLRAEDLPAELKNLDPSYKVLPPDAQRVHLWAQQLPAVYDAQSSETEWSGEFFAKWLAAPQVGTLKEIPLVVLSRADGGYSDTGSDVPAAQMEQERKAGQSRLLSLSANSKQLILRSGHNMNLEAPAGVANAIRQVVAAVRRHTPLS